MLKIYRDIECTKELEFVNGEYRLINIIPWQAGYSYKIELYVRNDDTYAASSIAIATDYTLASISISKTALEPAEVCTLTIVKDVIESDVSINAFRFSLNSTANGVNNTVNTLTLIKKVKSAKVYAAKNTVQDDVITKIINNKLDSKIRV